MKYCSDFQDRLPYTQNDQKNYVGSYLEVGKKLAWSLKEVSMKFVEVLVWSLREVLVWSWQEVYKKSSSDVCKTFC